MNNSEKEVSERTVSLKEHKIGMVAHRKRKIEKENKMVTIAYLLVFILLTILVLVIDIFTYHYSFMKAWGILFQKDMIWQNSPLRYMRYQLYISHYNRY